jgi:hypothetical protein
MDQLAPHENPPAAAATAMAPARWEFRSKQESSFSEEKEAKRLSFLCAVPDRSGGRKRKKVFWFFFSKKNRFLPS